MERNIQYRMPIARLLACIAMSVALAVPAATLRWSASGDITTQEPHAQDEGFTKAIQWMVYERWIQAGKDMEPVAWLATSWKMRSPTQRLGDLRNDRKFQ